MQGQICHLLFPKLEYKRSIKLKHGGKDKNYFTAGLYSLNWVKENNCNLDNVFGKPFLDEMSSKKRLPEEYLSIIDELLFAITPVYLHKICRFCQSADKELNINLNENDGLFELSLRPIIAYVEIAFKLLADCIIEKNKDYFTRNYTLKTIVFHSMLYIFWGRYVGKGMLGDFSGIYRLSQRSCAAKSISQQYPVKFSSDTQEIRDFLSEIRKHME